MPDAQQLFALAIVLAAAGYLVRRTWKRFSSPRAGGCGACSRCAATADNNSPAARPLIPLDRLIASVPIPPRGMADEGGDADDSSTSSGS